MWKNPCLLQDKYYLLTKYYFIDSITGMQTSTATVTQKGQVTIPVEMRNILGIKPYSKVLVSLSNKAVKLEPTLDIMDYAGFIKAPKGMDALKAREYMQTHYKRF
jgi:AbrB family looped-hinge helix DNA binding protein